MSRLNPTVSVRNLAGATAQVPDSLDPLIDLLGVELNRQGGRLPGQRPRSPEAFTRWYLDVVQALEASIAGGAGRQPMSRREVELMCRCALTGATLGESIALCAAFCAALEPRAGRIHTRVVGELLEFRLDSLRAEASSASQLCDITGLFAFHQLLQWLAGLDLDLAQVRVGPVQRDDVLPFLRLFGAPVLAGGHDYALHYPAAVQDLPVVRVSAEFAAFFEHYPCAVFGVAVNDFSGQVAAVLSAAARRDRGVPTQAALARSLGMALSTFRYRLRREGADYRSLRDQCLREEAARRLQRGGHSVGEIAAGLGFSDAAAFRRAFHRWFGCAPTRWRNNATRPA